jgi:hypothetical protein
MMSTQSGIASVAPARLAPVLNASCQCIGLDRNRLHQHLQQNLGDVGPLLDSRPGLVSGSVVFVDPQDVEAMDRAVQLVHRALPSDVFQQRVREQLPSVANLPGNVDGVLLGLDFHLGGPHPQLIEINTNPGGLLVNLELARAVTAACDCMTEPSQSSTTTPGTSTSVRNSCSISSCLPGPAGLRGSWMPGRLPFGMAC